MAAKKPAKPKKFKQARSTAKADAKKVFSGKAKARLKDATTKLSSDDAKALSEVSKEARGGYITDAQGNKIKTNVTPYEADRFDREGRQAREAFREKMREEGLYPQKENAPAKKAAPAKKTKPSKLGARRLDQMKKAGISEADAKKVLDTNKPAYQAKPATKGYSAGKTLQTEAGKARYQELIKQGVKPKSAMNKALFAEAKKTAPAKMTKPEMKAQSQKALDSIKKSMDKAVADRAPAKKAAVKKAVVKKAVVKKAAQKSVGSIVGNAVKKAAVETAMVAGPGKFLKAGKFVQAALGATKVARVGKAVKAAEGIKKVGAANTARKAVNAERAAKYAAQGKKGKLKKYAKVGAGLAAVDLIPKMVSGKKAPAKKVAPIKNTPAANAKTARLSPSHMAQNKSSKTFIASGGSTTYEVKKGDTLSSIAKTAGTTLADIRKANPKLMTDAKYKQGNVIWSGTKVKLPKKK